MPGHSKFGLSGTDLIHADDLKHTAGYEVAPSISVSTSKSLRNILICSFIILYS